MTNLHLLIFSYIFIFRAPNAWALRLKSPLAEFKDRHHSRTLWSPKSWFLKTNRNDNHSPSFKSRVFYTILNIDEFFMREYCCGIFVHFSLFWHRSVSSYFFWLKLSLLDIKTRKKKVRRTLQPHMGALFSAINS